MSPKPGTWMVAIGAMALAGCAIADVRPGVIRHETPKQIWSKFHGPEVRIRASVVSSHTSRMIEPVVYLADSAWLVIGDIGDDGTLRIVYPARPGDQNLVQKTRSFEGPRFQPRLEFPFLVTAFSTPRTAPGIAFVIASSSPLDLTKLAEGDRWSTFDVYYENHMNEPRPAITDLAAAIATNVGDISISYAPYGWGFIAQRPGSAERAGTMDRGGRRRIPRPPV